LVRPQNHLPGGVAELIDVMSGYVLKLRRELTRFRPFAVRSKTDFAQDGVERIGVHVVGKLVVIEALGALDRLSQYLSGRIAERDEVVADRIDLKRRCCGLILGQQLPQARKFEQLGRWNEILVKYDPVQQRA